MKLCNKESFRGNGDYTYISQCWGWAQWMAQILGSSQHRVRRYPNLPALPDIPVINLPTLPNLPPAPKIPELSSAIEVVLDIFKLVTLIQCLYRKVPLSPEWYLGTKVAHKTERQRYLPFDFLDIKIPTPQIEFIDKINIATNI